MNLKTFLLVLAINVPCCLCAMEEGYGDQNLVCAMCREQIIDITCARQVDYSGQFLWVHRTCYEPCGICRQPIATDAPTRLAWDNSWNRFCRIHNSCYVRVLAQIHQSSEMAEEAEAACPPPSSGLLDLIAAFVKKWWDE